FAANLRTALLAHESHAMELLNRWERLLVADRSIPVGEITYGDGGMAAAVRVASARRR
ncbi:MAG: glycosyl transferase, partial [Microbacterium sp. 14-71-5]